MVYIPKKKKKCYRIYDIEIKEVTKNIIGAN
jgi:hypothetical protein